MNSRASAIISALFIMVLVAIAATAMTLKLQIDISRTQLIKQTDEMKRIAKRATLKSISKLIAQLISPDNPKLASLKLKDTDGYHVTSHITDLQGLFNVNNLKNSEFIRPLVQLLVTTNPKIKIGEAIEISESLKDYISSTNTQDAHSRFDRHFAKYKISPPHMPMVSVTETRLLKGMTQKTYNLLLPLITALPSQTAININSAPLFVLQTIGAGLNEKSAKDLIKARGEHGFTSKKAFNQSAIAKKMQLKIDNKFLSLHSNFYLIAIKVKKDHDALTLFTKVQIQRNKKRIKTIVLGQSINTR